MRSPLEGNVKGNPLEAKYVLGPPLEALLHILIVSTCILPWRECGTMVGLPWKSLYILNYVHMHPPLEGIVEDLH